MADLPHLPHPWRTRKGRPCLTPSSDTNLGSEPDAAASVEGDLYAQEGGVGPHADLDGY